MEYQSGDLWAHPADLKVITTNGVVKRNGACVMGAGAAKQARDMWPGHCPDHTVKHTTCGPCFQALPAIDKVLGDHIVANGNVVGFFPLYNLISFPVKHHWRDSADLSIIDRSCRDFRAHFESYILENDLTIAIIPPGIGNGRLAWSDVHPVVHRHLGDMKNLVMMLPDHLPKEIVVPSVQRVINVRGGDFTNVDVYIGRCMPQVPDGVEGGDGFWGNPIKITSDTEFNRKEAIIKYWEWLNSDDPRAVANRKAIRGGVLKDKNLGCWCAPKLCHGHVLARLANDPDGVQYCKDTIEKFRTQINTGEVS